MKKTFTKIPTNWINEALQILNNFCSQSTRFCDECYLRNRKGTHYIQFSIKIRKQLECGY